MKARLGKFLGIFLLSLSLITYEIGLTRLFSAIFQYHYVFLVISFSVLGLGMGGYFLHLTRNSKRDWVSLIQKSYGWVYLMTLAVIYFMPYLQSLLIYIVLGTIPFFLGGVLLSHYFQQKDLQINQIYFADLMGSTVGVVLVVLSFQNIGVFSSMILMVALAFISSLLLEQDQKRRIILAVMALVMVGLVLIPGVEEWGVHSFNGIYTSPYSAMEGRESEYVFWDAFARTDVYTSKKDEKVILLDGSAAAPVNRFDGDLSSIQHMKEWISYLPFKLGGGEKVLVIGPGGGEDILNAILAGYQDITAVEINPGSIKAVEALADFSGDIYNDPRVKTYVQDGRNFVEQNTEKFDQINLSVVMTNLADHGGKVLVENYIYTQEAIREYLNDLNPGGYVNFVMHQQNDLLRLLSTIVNLLSEEGKSDEEIIRQLVVYYDPKIKHGNHEMMMYPVLTLKNRPFTRNEAIGYHNQIRAAGYEFLTMPYLHENPLFRKLASGEYSYKVFEERLGYSMRPVTDNHPFIYQPQRGIPSYLKVMLLVIGFGLIVSYFFAAAEFKRIKQLPRKMGYFVMLGFGFMMIEIVMMQLFAVYLGYPILTFAMVLGTLLLTSGLGSYLSDKVGQLINPLLVVGLYGLVLTFGIPQIVQQTMHWELGLKMLVIFGLLGPLGFFMGMGFPLGIQRLKASGEEKLIPLIWAINGIASVGGSVLSISVALLVGFQMVSLIGVAFYLGGYWLSPGDTFLKGVTGNEKVVS